MPDTSDAGFPVGNQDPEKRGLDKTIADKTADNTKNEIQEAKDGNFARGKHPGAQR